MMAEGGRGDISNDRQVGNGGISNTVEVRGFSANINKELLEMYFENSRRSGGGDTEEVQIGDGVAYITFMEADVAQRVVSCNNHQVGGQTLTVALFHPSPPKPCYENRVLIQGLNNAITEELLTNLLEKGMEAKVREFLYGEDEGKVVVTLSENIDIAQLRKIFRERSIEKASLQVARVDMSNSIIVQNLQPCTLHDVILFYFENKKRSGGGDVERVEMKADEGYCLVYFEDPNVIDRVLSQSHKVDGADVEVHIHHECLGKRSSRNRFDPFLRSSSPGQTDSAILEEGNIDNQAKDKTPNSVSSNPEKESDFVEVQEWQENDGKNCTLPLWIKYTRAPEMMITKDMKKIPCNGNFCMYWNFYTKTTQGQQLLNEIISKYNCSVSVCSDDEDLFIFEISAKSFEQKSDVIRYIHDVLDNIYKSAQQFLYSDIILVEQRMQGDILQLMKQRKELDSARIELMGQQDNDAMCIICTEKDKKSVLHVVAEIIHNVRDCFENHEEIISIDHTWQKVMKTFGYIQKLCDKFPKVTIILDETKPDTLLKGARDQSKAAILLKGPRDKSKAAADHLIELVRTAQTEVKEDIFSPFCQFEIFTYSEMCDYIDSIMMELSIVWIPDQLTKKIHIFSKKLDKVMSIDKLIKGCIHERAYPLERDQLVHSPEIHIPLENLKRKHTGKIVMNLSPIGLLVTTADDIFEGVDAEVLEILAKQTCNSSCRHCRNVIMESKILVAAIDFGTAYSGWACSFRHEYNEDPTKIISRSWLRGSMLGSKTPTTILIKPDGITLDSFGCEAEDKYADLAAEKNSEYKRWYYFRHFKRMLHTKMHHERNMHLEDETNKFLPAMTVFSLAIRYLKDDILKCISDRVPNALLSEDEIMWVLTVPAIWNDCGKQFMKEAASEAGIKNENILIALEPVAASIFCSLLPKKMMEEGGEMMDFSPGSKYMVLDAGGGAIDITVYEVMTGRILKELHRACGGALGGTQVDDAYKEFLISLVGKPVFQRFQSEYRVDYLDMFGDFQIKKKRVTTEKEGKVVICLPSSLEKIFKDETRLSLHNVMKHTQHADRVSLKGDTLWVEASVMKGFFSKAIQNTVSHVKELMKDSRVQGISSILMVGGFSESKMLQHAIKNNFPNVRVIVPQDAGSVTLKGAVIFGHNPLSVV